MFSKITIDSYDEFQSNSIHLEQTIINNSVIILNPADNRKTRCPLTIINTGDFVFFVLFHLVRSTWLYYYL
jgi:hypothetical protein